MKRMALLLLAGLLFGGAGDPPRAATEPQPAVPAPGPETAAPASGSETASITPESLAAAHELLTAMNAQSNALAMFKGLRGVLVQNIESRTRKPEDEVAKIVDEVLMPEVESRMDEFIDALAHVQASVYTIDEMHQLIAFYQSPIGKRTIELMPKIGAMSFSVGQEWGKRVALDALRKNADELRRRGIKL